MVSLLLEILKIVRDAESEARKILDEAKVEAERISRVAKTKADEVYSKVYEQAVAGARRRSVELQEKRRNEAEREAEVFLRHAQEQIEQIRIKAEERFDEAVDAILNEIVS